MGLHAVLLRVSLTLSTVVTCIGSQGVKPVPAACNIWSHSFIALLSEEMPLIIYFRIALTI